MTLINMTVYVLTYYAGIIPQ